MKLFLLLFLLQISLSASSEQTFQITFPSNAADPYAKTKNQAHNVKDFTLSFWFSLPTTSETTDTLLSYNPLSVSSIFEKNLRNDVQNPLIYISYQSKDGNTESGRSLQSDNREWIHMCITLESIPNGIRTIKRFVNGGFRGSSKGEDDGIYPDRGIFLGKKVTKPEEEKMRIEPFKGRISEVNLWNYVLPDHEIELLYKNCTYVSRGNVVRWDLSEWEIHGNAEVSPVHLPCMGVEEKKSPKGNSSSYISIRGSLLEGFLFLVFMWIL